jgi:tetratricopeptide (TPR) repeat protein
MAKAKHATDLKDYLNVEKYCNEQLLLDPSDTEALRLKAFATSMRGALEQAIQAIDGAIAVTSGSPEPSDYFDRGRWLLELGRLSESISAFSKVIDLSERHEDSYYLESAYLHRAVAYGRAEKRREAISDLQQVSQDCACFALGKIHTKEALISELT